MLQTKHSLENPGRYTEKDFGKVQEQFFEKIVKKANRSGWGDLREFHVRKVYMNNFLPTAHNSLFYKRKI